MQQHMIQRIAARPRGLDEDAEILPHRLLADEIRQALGPDRGFGGVFAGGGGADHAAFGHALSSFRPARISASSGGVPPSRRAAWATAPNASVRR